MNRSNRFDARCTCGWQTPVVDQVNAEAAARTHRKLWTGLVPDGREHETSVAPVALNAEPWTVDTFAYQHAALRSAFRDLGGVLMHEWIIKPLDALARWRRNR